MFPNSLHPKAPASLDPHGEDIVNWSTLAPSITCHFIVVSEPEIQPIWACCLCKPPFKVRSDETVVLLVAWPGPGCRLPWNH